MEKRTGKKIGIVALKVLLTLVTFVIAAGLGGKLSKAISGESYTSVSMGGVFMISMIIPIWYGTTTRWRISAVGAGIAAGVFTWTISLFVGSLDLFGFLRGGAIVVSFLVCVSVLRAGRLKRVGILERANKFAILLVVGVAIVGYVGVKIARVETGIRYVARDLSGGGSPRLTKNEMYEAEDITNPSSVTIEHDGSYSKKSQLLLEEVRSRFTINGRPIHPFVFRDLQGWISDNTPIITTIDVLAGDNSNYYFQDRNEKRTDGFIARDGSESYGYSFIGRLEITYW